MKAPGKAEHAVGRNIQHQVTAPGCRSGMWQRSVLHTRLSPAMSLSPGMGGESGDEVAMSPGSGLALQAS